MNKNIAETAGFLVTIINAIPYVTLIVDEDVKIQYWNNAAAPVVGEHREHVYRKRGGDVMHCLHASGTPQGCGSAEQCRDCIIRGSVKEAMESGKLCRHKTMMQVVRGGNVIEQPLMVTASPLQYEEKNYCVLILEDLSDVIQLKGIIPICSNCKKMRNDEDYWESVEKYIQTHIIDLEFSHGICPDCFSKLYPDIYKRLHDPENKGS